MKKPMLQTVFGYGLHVIKFPTGKWGYVGTLPTELATKVAATQSDVMGGRAFKEGENLLTWKFPIFDSKKAAVDFAKSKGFAITKSNMKVPKNSPAFKRSRYAENPRKAPVDEAAAWELHLYAENNIPPGSPDSYKQQAWNQKESIIKNLAKKLRKGVYDKKLAAKLWSYYAETCAKLYSKDFSTGSDWNSMFSVATRLKAGEHLEEANREQVEEAAELGLVGAKKNPRSRKPKGRAVVLKGDKFSVARALADAGIPFVFIEEAGGNTVGSVPTQFIDKLSEFLSANPEFEGRFARHSTQVAAEKRFSMARKKRRTPAQIAATKKLVAMNKKRRAGKRAKNPGRKRATSRGKHGYFQIAAPVGGRVKFWNGSGWGTRAMAVRYAASDLAHIAARKVGRECAIVSNQHTDSGIAEFFGRGKA